MSVTADSSGQSANNRLLFWGCFIALVTTAFGFTGRMFLIDTWAAEFKLDPAQSGRLAGIGIWPFAASIIGFSLFIDKIGYKVAMFMAFVGHASWAGMGFAAYRLSQSGDTATAYQLLYWGSLILALGNGTVEAFINPVVATIFSREKTKWLNILHAGWPGGLVTAGVILIYLGDIPWGYKIGIIAIPTVVYLVMLLPCRFPVQERVASGVSYREMLSEFGVLGASIVGFLVALQLMDFFKPADGELSTGMKVLFAGVGAAVVLGFGLYTRALGSTLMFVLVLIMIPLATTEIGTDGWITSIMEGVAQGRFHAGWILVYTSAIMMILRFFAGPIVHALSPLGLLAVSAGFAIAGLYMLSSAAGSMIFIAATLYGLGKTFFWPTMLGVVAEQTPRGGALTLNAISGIGMLAVGTLGFPYIGTLKADKEIEAVSTNTEVRTLAPTLVEGEKLTTLASRDIYEIIHYEAIDDDKLSAVVNAIPDSSRREEAKTKIASLRAQSSQKALANMAVFPVIMLVGYLLLIAYFKSRGGYKQVHLDGGGGH